MQNPRAGHRNSLPANDLQCWNATQMTQRRDPAPYGSSGVQHLQGFNVKEPLSSFVEVRYPTPEYLESTMESFNLKTLSVQVGEFPRYQIYNTKSHSPGLRVCR